MVDLDRVTTLLRTLEENCRLLEEITARGREAFLDDVHVQFEFERLLQVALQLCIDAGAHVIASDGFESPSEYAEIFTALGERGVLDRDLAERLAVAAGTRNLLVHGYLKMDLGRLFDELSLDDLRAFRSAILSYASA